jgi:hypothetical protein
VSVGPAVWVRAATAVRVAAGGVDVLAPPKFACAVWVCAAMAVRVPATGVFVGVSVGVGVRVAVGVFVGPVGVFVFVGVDVATFPQSTEVLTSVMAKSAANSS